MKTDKETEKLLLNDAEYDKIVKMKIEREFNDELQSVNTQKEKVFTDIKEIPAERLFSKSAVFEVINKTSKTKSYINGVQAEGYLGADNVSRKKLLGGESSSFVSGSNYIKFVKCNI